jgi:hypothetical protein
MPTNAIFIPYWHIPNKQNLRIGVFGKSGSGKSMFIARCILDTLVPEMPYAESIVRKYPEMRNQFKKFKIIIISGVSEDEQYDRERQGRMPTRLDIHNTDFQSLTKEFFRNTIAIFDDVENISVNQIKKDILALRNMLLEQGRHVSCQVVTVSHKALSGNDNKIVKSECTHAVFFPRSGPLREIKAFMKEYAQMEQNKIDYLIKLMPRYIMLKIDHPSYYVSDKEIGLI